MSPCRYIIASRASWHRGMAARLAAKTGRDFAQVENDESLMDALEAEPRARYVFFTHWSNKIARAVWEPRECIIFHMTDVPYGRGGSPLQNLIVRGHTETVISAIRCVDAFDAGPVYLKRPLSLDGSADEIFSRASVEMERMIAHIVEHEPVPVPQEGAPTIFRRRSPADSVITPGMTLQQLYDHIRMLDAEGYPHAFLDVGALRLEFTGAKQESDTLTAQVRIRAAARVATSEPVELNATNDEQSARELE